MSAAAQDAAGLAPDPDSMYDALDVHMLNSDPPDHERLRRLVNKAFTPRRVDGSGRGSPRSPRATRRHVGQRSTCSRSLPLPITVMQLLGVRGTGTTSMVGHSFDTPPRVPGDATAMSLLHGAAGGQAARARRRPAVGFDLGPGRGDRLSENELVSMAFLLLVAGHETTVNLIGSGVLALLLNPGELARLRDFGSDPALTGGAVEELLRYVNPVSNATFRCAAEPVEIGGVRIGRGDRGARGAERGEPGPGPVRSTRASWTWAGTPLGAPGVRSRHPLLPGRAAGPAGGGDRLLSPAGAVRLDAAGGARRVAALAAEHAHPRPGVPAGAAVPANALSQPGRTAGAQGRRLVVYRSDGTLDRDRARGARRDEFVRYDH